MDISEVRNLGGLVFNSVLIIAVNLRGALRVGSSSQVGEFPFGPMAFFHKVEGVGRVTFAGIQDISSLKKPSRQKLRPLCDQVGPEDGIDPREALKAYRKSLNRGQTGERPWSRKAKQLGRQIGETLEAVFAGDSRDDLLRNLRVVSVVPAPDASRLLVTVAPLETFDGLNPIMLIEHLERASGRLRSEVASSITRKRAPVLIYRIDWPFQTSGEHEPSV